MVSDNFLLTIQHAAQFGITETTKLYSTRPHHQVTPLSASAHHCTHSLVHIYVVCFASTKWRYGTERGDTVLSLAVYGHFTSTKPSSPTTHQPIRRTCKIRSNSAYYNATASDNHLPDCHVLFQCSPLILFPMFNWFNVEVFVLCE